MKKTILLVEDNPDDVELTLEAFSEINLLNKIIVAHDGAEALELLLSTAALPQLILLDLKLPKVDGLEVLRQVRATPRTRRLPVVILTSSKEESDLVRSYDLGVNSYVRKPVDFNQFAQAVSQLGLYWLLLNEVPSDPGVK
ncbi:MAG: response regulator [Gallionellaceae bacterium]|nr:response regulator [Gallionellaceae bacterium]